MTEQPTWWKFARTTKPDLEILKRILNEDFDLGYTPNQIKAIQLKYKSMTTVPTIIEKTMSPEQLYNVQNPLWARDYTIQELYYYYKYRKEFDNYKQVDAVIRKGEKLNQAIKKYNSQKEKDWEPSETYSEYENRWEKAVSVYTNFSGNTGRLYDVLYHMREYKDEFSREGDYTVNVSTKAELEHILDKETDDALLDKWDDIMEYLEYIDDDETLYFFTDQKGKRNVNIVYIRALPNPVWPH